MPRLILNRATTGTLLTLVIAITGGWLGHWLAGDAGWLLGALIATLAGALKGFPLRYASMLQSMVIVLVGISIGSMLQPGMLVGMANWLPTLAGLFISVLLTLAGVAFFLNRYGNCEHNTSVLAAYPGHLVVILQLATQHPCDAHKVATIQSLRMLFLVLFLPALAYIWMPEQASAHESTDYVAFGWLSVAGIAGVVVAWLLKMPASLLVGAMTGSGLAALSGTSIGTLPEGLKVAIFVLTGAMIGTRFVNTHWSAIANILPVAISAMSITMLISAAIALPVAWVTDVAAMQLLLAYAPGGAEVMSLIALATGHDPAFVGLHHIVRLLAMAALFPLLVKLAIR
ncbi:MAG: AbrB family transcriptional regulator [Halomonas sp.]|nr:AbrB family transcriptional regulator [Halomonas sp.]TVP49394.1 MAG: AbrB family transcriptional regulator [Halomonas sp.]